MKLFDFFSNSLMYIQFLLLFYFVKKKKKKKISKTYSQNKYTSVYDYREYK